MFIALSFVMSAACLVPAFGKLLGHPKMLAAAAHFGVPWNQYRLLGVPELAAAVGVLIGLVWAPVGLAAASGMVVLLFGALVAHRRAGDGIDAAPAVAALAITISYLAVALAR